MGYIGVNDVEVTASQIKRRGGTVYVPPTDTNIGFISVVTDPQTANFALIRELKVGRQQTAESGKPGRVGWHELFAADWEQAFAFYAEIFGWQRADGETSQTDIYHPFSAGGLTIGGMFTKHRDDPLPFWLLYFNVGDLDVAVERVKAGGGLIIRSPLELPGGLWIVRCMDPQGAAFALQGKQRQDSKVGWSTAWSGFSSRGRLVAPKTRDRGRPPDSEA